MLRSAVVFCMKTLFGAVFLSVVYFTISYLFLFPTPEIQIKKKLEAPEAIVYQIWISNPSIMGIFNIDIYNLEFVLRFDEKLPIRKVEMTEANYYSGMKILSNEGWTLREVNSQNLKPYPSPINLVSGIIGATNRFSPGTIVSIVVLIDKTYDGKLGDVFPPNFKLRLRSNSYYITYKHRPLGEFAPIYISKSYCKDFMGYASEMDNIRKYVQRTTLTSGEVKDVVLEVEKIND